MLQLMGGLLGSRKLLTAALLTTCGVAADSNSAMAELSVHTHTRPACVREFEFTQEVQGSLYKQLWLTCPAASPCFCVFVVSGCRGWQESVLLRYVSTDVFDCGYLIKWEFKRGARF